MKKLLSILAILALPAAVLAFETPREIGGGAGVGDVVGPASATNDAVCRYDLATGKLLQSSESFLDDTGAYTGVFSVGFDSTSGNGIASTAILSSLADGALTLAASGSADSTTLTTSGSGLTCNDNMIIQGDVSLTGDLTVSGNDISTPNTTLTIGAATSIQLSANMTASGSIVSTKALAGRLDMSTKNSSTDNNASAAVSATSTSTGGDAYMRTAVDGGTNYWYMGIDQDTPTSLAFEHQGDTILFSGTNDMTLTSAGDLTLRGDIAVNGDDITSDGALTITPTGNLSLVVATGEVTVSANNATATIPGMTIVNGLAGDAIGSWLVVGRRWYAGIDNSDSNSWKLASTAGFADFGTDTFITVETSGDTVFSGDLAVNGDDITSDAALTITPAATNNLNVVLSGTGDFVVNTDDLVVDTSTGNVSMAGALSVYASLELGSTALPSAHVDFIDTDGNDFDSRIILSSNGLVMQTGGQGSTATALTLNSDQNTILAGGLSVGSATVEHDAGHILTTSVNPALAFVDSTASADDLQLILDGNALFTRFDTDDNGSFETTVATHTATNLSLATAHDVTLSNTTAESAFHLSINQNSTGDALQTWLVPGRRWYAGIDNSDSDIWKLATTGFAPAFGTDTAIAVDTSRGVAFPGEAGANAEDYVCIATSTGAISSKATACTGSSSRKLKANIRPTAIDSSKILDLEIVDFEWKDDRRGGGTQTGVIAEDVEKVYPHLIGYGKTGKIDGVHYDRIALLAVLEIKKLSLWFSGLWDGHIEQDERISYLEAENASLAQQLIDLNDRLLNLEYN